MTTGAQTRALLDRARAFIERFIVLSDENALIALSLFVLHTWAIEAAIATPYIVVVSPEKRSGKTRLLEVLALLVREPWHSAGASEAAIFRKIEAVRPTLLLDETDAIFGSRTERTEPLRALLNAGNRRGASVTRIVGSKFEPRDFSVFCPKVLAGIDTGRLPETIVDRAVVLRMHRCHPGERVERLRLRLVESEAARLKDDLQAWASKAIDHLRDALPELPDELGDRAADAWEPLLAIADLAGDDWPGRTRTVAVESSTSADGDEIGRGTQLLAAARGAMNGAERITTADLQEIINADDSLPFGGWNESKGIDPRSLARLLKPYGIKSRTIRIGEVTAKGYHARDFEDAWERYLPSARASQASQPPHPVHRPSTEPHHHSDVTNVTDVTAPARGATVAVSGVCAYPSHAEHWHPHPLTERVICWRCHPPATGSS
jgi:hypothetical protein